MTDSCSPFGRYRYALVTAAHNEEMYIETTIKAVIAQEVPPARWVIVSDGSTDGTDEVVSRYATRIPYIRFLRKERGLGQGFASKVKALEAGVAYLVSCECEFIGILDADVSFPPTYFRDLLQRFLEDRDLGIGGGYICELRKGRFSARRDNRPYSVAGAVQMFRRECYQQIGGLKPLVYGGEDTCANFAAQMSNWKVQSFSELHVFHHRITGGVGGRLLWHYRQGLMDYSLGSDPSFEVVKVCAKAWSWPPLIGVSVRLAAFMLASIRHMDRPVTIEFVRFVRSTQRARLLRFKMNVQATKCR